MASDLEISLGQYSDKGRKDSNQDFHGAMVPEQPALGMKGIAVVLADGISSSDVSHIASEATIKSFMTDYYCTSDAWTVRTSANRIIAATNSWLHAQSRRSHHAYDRDKGYVCTMSALVLKARTAHIFHVGDSRIYRVTSGALEQLTEDHRVVISSHESYLGRALGMNPTIEIDYQAEPLKQGDVFVLMTDGVFEFASPAFITDTIATHTDDLSQAAKLIVEEAFAQSSGDNLTIQIVRIDALPDSEAADILGQAAELPVPPLLEPRMEFDGYKILREIHATSRSHIYLAEDSENGALVALKIPSIDLRDDPAYLKRFLLEEWIARRLDNAHILKVYPQARERNFLYNVTEYVDGQTLAQWMIDHPKPDMEAVRAIAEQIATGLRAIHRKEMVHQDLRPQNIMIDASGTVKIIDFGSTKVAGVRETEPTDQSEEILGTHQFTAPEYFLGEHGTTQSDLFSLGVIVYQMLTGKLPYGATVSRARTRAQQRKLQYQSALDDDRDIPEWIDGALKKAVHPDPLRRYQVMSEFMFDLRHPNKHFMTGPDRPLLERSPVMFWKSVSLFLAGVVLLLLARPYL